MLHLAGRPRTGAQGWTREAPGPIIDPTMSKEEILKVIERLPENVTEADVIEELYFRLQVERGLKDATEGRVLGHAELKERIAQWRRSAGR